MDLSGILHELLPYMSPLQTQIFIWILFVILVGVAGRIWLPLVRELFGGGERRKKFPREGYKKFKSREIVSKQ